MMGVTAQIGRNPAQRHFRHLRTMSTHGGVHWDRATPPIDRYVLGIETSDPLFDKHNTFLDE